jgi:hypothetical protein
LTNYISGNGKYPITGSFSGGRGGVGEFNILGSRANPMGPVSSMAFSSENPQMVVCSSPFTGVFIKNETTGWKDLSYLLPKPYTPVSSVAIAQNGIYVATEGRGLLLLKSD